MSRSFVSAVLLLGSGFVAEAAEDSAARQTVYLTVREPEGYNPSSCAAPLLERELVRQAFLIAVRDELGISTRDVLLREDFPKKPDENSVPFELYCQVARVKKDFDVEYRLSRGSIDKVIWRWVFNTDINNPKSLNTLAETAELFSRRQLKDVLIRGGWIGTVPAARESADVPSATQDLLWSWNEVSVMAGLRRVHAEIRAKGESPELLAALAVGYVNLGSLTDYYYSACFKAYYARALLYAERLVRKTNASPWALWHRGYVRLLLGLHNFGAEDIAEARKKPGAAPSAKPLPFWAEVMEAFGQGELSRMLQIAKTPPQRALARYLNLQAVMYGDLVDLKIKTANDLVEQCPDCPRAYNELALSGALGPMRQAAYSAFGQTGTFLRKRLLDVPGLPEELAKRLRSSEVNSDEPAEVEFRKSLIASLKHAGAPEVDRGEPSLSALGHALEEIDFAQVMRRLEFEGHALAVSTRETIALYEPLCEAHPYAAYIDAYTNHRKEIEAAAAGAGHQARAAGRDLQGAVDPAMAVFCDPHATTARLVSGPPIAQRHDVWGRDLGDPCRVRRSSRRPQIQPALYDEDLEHEQ
jgi:hypothetical protein